MQYCETKFGFSWGAASVNRVTEHEGHVVLEISTDRQTLEVRVTPGGLIRAGAVKKRSKP